MVYQDSLESRRMQMTSSPDAKSAQTIQRQSLSIEPMIMSRPKYQEESRKFGNFKKVSLQTGSGDLAPSFRNFGMPK
jgi:hypothetical protein